MSIDWKRLKQMAIVTICVIIAIYALDYGLSLLSGISFEHPSTGGLIGATVAANFSVLRNQKNKE